MKQMINLKEAREKRRELEKAIDILLSQFTKETELNCDLNVYRTEEIGRDTVVGYQTKIKLYI